VIRGSCHCGAIIFEVPEAAPRVVECNCSICRRYATLWVHAPPSKGVVLNAPEGTTNTYSWGDKNLIFHSCKVCHCITHWSGREGPRFAVNVRLADPADIADIPVRHFDGADTWKFLD